MEVELKFVHYGFGDEIGIGKHGVDRRFTVREDKISGW